MEIEDDDENGEEDERKGGTHLFVVKSAPTPPPPTTTTTTEKIKSEKAKANFFFFLLSSLPLRGGGGGGGGGEGDVGDARLLSPPIFSRLCLCRVKKSDETRTKKNFSALSLFVFSPPSVVAQACLNLKNISVSTSRSSEKKTKKVLSFQRNSNFPRAI